MAEALAVNGLVSAIVQFIDFETEVVARLKEFDTDTKEMPKTFQDLKIRLLVVINGLRRQNIKVNSSDE